jgi:hypothetical protein
VTTTEEARIIARLQEFYSIHYPDKIYKVPSIVERWKDQHPDRPLGEILTDVMQKYGQGVVTPATPATPPAPAPAPI